MFIFIYRFINTINKKKQKNEVHPALSPNNAPNQDTKSRRAQFPLRFLHAKGTSSLSQLRSHPIHLLQPSATIYNPTASSPKPYRTPFTCQYGFRQNRRRFRHAYVSVIPSLARLIPWYPHVPNSQRLCTKKCFPCSSPHSLFLTKRKERKEEL